jgi:glycosyltransferase involved in cell wall biosynthesis
MPSAEQNPTAGVRDEDIQSRDASCDVTIVMPCLNEEETLAYCIDNAREGLKQIFARFGLTGEIVVADNGSVDRSCEIAQEAGARVVQTHMRGYGRALIEGFTAARGRYLIMGDADGSYDFREAVPMIAALLEGDQLCVGTRMRGRIVEGAMPFKNRYIGNPLLSGLLNVLFNSRLSDAHCGLRAITQAAFRRLRLTSEGMEFASEMIIKAALLGLPRREVPITLHPDRRRRPSHLRPWRDGWRHLRYLLMLAPGWLFYVPATFIAAVSLGIMVPNMLFADARGLWLLFGTHWVIMACTGLVFSHALFMFGAAGVVYGVNAGFRPTPSPGILTRYLSLESFILTGAFLLLLGVAGISWVSLHWIEVSFGPPDSVRQLAVSSALFVVGAQQIFGGFMLSIIGGNRAHFLAP